MKMNFSCSQARASSQNYIEPKQKTNNVMLNNKYNRGFMTLSGIMNIIPGKGGGCGCGR